MDQFIKDWLDLTSQTVMILVLGAMWASAAGCICWAVRELFWAVVTYWGNRKRDRENQKS